MPKLLEHGLHHLARTLCAVPPAVQTALTGGPIVIDGQTLDPQLRLLLRATEILDRGRPTDLMQVREHENRSARVAGGFHVDHGVVVRDLEVAGMRARHYLGPAGAPLLVFFHGGGFFFGDLDSHDVPCRLITKHAGVHVLAVAYRLAPEHRYPAAVEDAVTALRWAQEHVAELDADPERIGIGGDSAGGNLAAVVAQVTRDDRPPVAQLLVYPAISRRREWRSLELFKSGFFLSADAIRWFDAQYTGPGYVRPETPDPRLDPLHHPDLANLAPALVITAGFDPLRDEGEAYGEALAAAGNRVVVRRFPSLVHGFLNMGGISTTCHDAVVEVAGATRMLFPARHR